MQAQAPGTAGPTPRFPLRAPAAAARGREGKGGRAGTVAPSRISQAIPRRISWGRNEGTLTKLNPASGGEHCGVGVVPGYAKILLGWGGQGSLCTGVGVHPAVGLGIIPQPWDEWDELSGSGVMAHPAALLAPGSSASADIKHKTVTKQKTPQGLENPV